MGNGNTLLHSEATTENHRNQCFQEQVLDRLETYTFNEVIHLYMRPENKDFISNSKILETFENLIILVEQTDMRYTIDFFGCSEKLVEKINCEIFLVLICNIVEQPWSKIVRLIFRVK